MKVLQITTNNEPLEVPKVLEINSESGLFFDGTDIRVLDDTMFAYCDTVCSLDDCYQSRPLIEIGEWCEFDLLEDSLDSEVRLLTVSTNKIATLDQMNETGVVLHNWWLNPTTQEIKNIGSIFTKENQEKYPKLLKKALGLINP